MTLPAGWRLFTPHELAGEDKTRLIIGPFGSNLKTSDYRADGVPLVFVKDIRQGSFRTPRQFVDSAKADELRSHVAIPGDVLITKMGEPPGDAAVYTGTQPAVITADCIRLRPIDDFDPRFIALAMQAPAVKRQVELITSGIAQRKVSLARFRSGLSIPVPPLEEQRRIVDILDDHLSRLDATDAYLAAAVHRAESLRWRAALDAVTFAGGLEVRLGDIASVRNGIFVSRPGSLPNGVPILRIGAVRSLALDLSDLRYSERSEDDLRDADGLALPGDLLFTRYNGNPRFVGACAVVPPDAPTLTYPDKLIRVRIAGASALPTFVALACSVGDTRAQIQACVRTTAGQAGISGRDLKSVTLRLPAADVQETVVAAARESGSASIRLTRDVEAARRRAAALRRSLLAAAFSGRLTGDREFAGV